MQIKRNEQKLSNELTKNNRDKLFNKFIGVPNSIDTSKNIPFMYNLVAVISSLNILPFYIGCFTPAYTLR